MMNKYSKNFILCGDIDYYCLLCQEIFKGIPDIEKHIRWEKHRKCLKSQTYFPKFRKDFIFKVANKYYYCEICNLVNLDIATVTDHIKADKHKAMKNNPKIEMKNFIGQYNSNYVLIDKVIINMTQWNSIVDDKCLLCDTNVTLFENHMESEDHIIKLIQSETKYEDGKYYRKINSDNYYCFTCKKVFSQQNFDKHWQKCENTDEIEIKKLKDANSNKNIRTSTKEVSVEIEKKLIDTLQEFFYIEETNNFATCKYCSTCVSINFKSMIEHMKNQHDHQQPKRKTKGSDESSEDEVVYREVTDYGKRRAELAKYGRQHSIKMNFNGSKGWCFICDKYLSAHKNIFKQHIKGSIHRGHLELQGLKKAKKRSGKKYNTKSILEYSLQYVCNEKIFNIDNDYAIDVLSFFLLRQIQNDPHYKKTKCYACNELFPQGQERDHCMTPKHKNNFIAAKVIQLNDDGRDIMHEQFFREIRPNLFHCGFCNQTIPFSDEMYEHHTTEKHEILQEGKTGKCYLDAIAINNETGDIYTKLVHYGFDNN